jgi:hypothetical protein
MEAGRIRSLEKERRDLIIVDDHCHTVRVIKQANTVGHNIGHCDGLKIYLPA